MWVYINIVFVYDTTRAQIINKELIRLIMCVCVRVCVLKESKEFTKENKLNYLIDMMTYIDVESK